MSDELEAQEVDVEEPARIDVNITRIADSLVFGKWQYGCEALIERYLQMTQLRNERRRIIVGNSQFGSDHDLVSANREGQSLSAIDSAQFDG